MKRLSLTILLLTFLLSGIALAQNDSGFGLGVMFGEPTGLSGKGWLSSSTSLNAGVAWSFQGDSEFTLQCDYVWHKFDLISVSSGKLPLYYGIGARFRSHKNSDSNFGARIPVGLNYMWDNSHFDVFAELVPIIDLAPDLKFRLGAAIGGRYFF